MKFIFVCHVKLILGNCKYERLTECREIMLLCLNLKFYITVLVKYIKHINKSCKEKGEQQSV